MRIYAAGASTLLTDHAGHGEGLICWEILRRLAARGHDVVACTNRARLQADPDFEVVELGDGSRFESLHGLGYARLVQRELDRRGRGEFDVAYWAMPQGLEHLVWAPRDLGYVVGPLAASWPGRPRVRLPGDLLRGAVAPLAALRHRRALGRADRLLVSLPAVGDGLPRAARARAVTAPFGVDPGGPCVAPPAAPVVVFVGSLDVKKGVHDLVAAFPEVRRQVPDARLLLVGDGPARGDILPTPGLELLGPVAHPEVAGLLAGASVVCVPSHGEPFGMVVLEAMAAGRPVVATAAGGPSHLLDAEGAVLTPVGDVAALAAGLAAVLLDPVRAQAMGAHNRSRVEAALTWDACVDHVEQALEAAA